MQELVINELTSLERKLSLLINEHRSLKEQIRIHKEENSELKAVLAEKQEQLKEFHNKAKISKLVNSIGADKSDTADLRIKLDDYIKEIDKCIAFLSN
ncbi:MAG: hypothetical protein IH947_03950 [Bacteroidetes bacterium]|nr:hypothetical protein [Bacteroidota bacterium]MCH8232126.1 hypothetical protein [Bacteroidota bacterium]